MSAVDVGRMSAWDLTEWAVFERDFGPLTLHERMDALIGHLAYVVHSTAGGKGTPEQFVPQWKTPKPLTGEGVAAWFRAVAGSQN
jgi:hypothetical protein